MNSSSTLRVLCLTIALFSFACDSSSTTDGRPGRGGDTAIQGDVDREQGGTSADWSKGSGVPGSAPSPKAPNE